MLRIFFIGFCIIGLQISASANKELAHQDIISISEAKIDRDGNFIPDRLGDTVSIAGRVTVESGILWSDRFQIAIQDPTAGIFVFSFEDNWPKISSGDSIHITGVVDQYRGLTQMIHPKISVIDTVNRNTIKPILLKGDNIENSESKIVTLTSHIIQKRLNSGGSYLMVAPPEGFDQPLMIFNPNLHKFPNLLENYKVGEKIKITGLLFQHDYNKRPDGNYQILPLSSKDLMLKQFSVLFYLYLIGGGIIITLSFLIFNILLRKKVKNRTKQLKESESRFSDLTESTSSAILIHLENQFVYANQAIEKISGFSKSDILFKPLHELGEIDENKLIRIKRSKKTFHAESQFTLSNNNKIWLDYTIAPITWNNKNASIITAVDLTSQKQAEVKAELSENRFQFLANSAPVGIFRNRTNGDITYVNPKWSKLSGMSADKAMGQGWMEAIHPDYRQILRDRWDETKNEIKATIKEYCFLHQNGKEVWVISQATPEYDENKNIIGYVGSVTDITELKTTEKLLKISEEKYKYLFHKNPHPMWIYDLETLRFLEVNKTAVLKYGYSREEFLTMTLMDIRPEEDRNKLLIDVKQTSNPFNNAGTWRHVNNYNEIIDVEIASHQIKYNDRPARMVLVNDVTTQKTVQDALQKSEQSLNEAQQIAKMGDWEYDLTTKKTKWSENCFRLFDLQPNEIEPSQEYFRSRVHPEDRTATIQGFNSVLENKTFFESELRILVPGKTDKWILNKVIPAFENGKLVKIKGVSIDIDILKKSTLALKESEEKFRGIFENHSAIKMIVDPITGEIEDANQAASNYYGLSRNEIKNKEFHEVNFISKELILNELQKVNRGEQNMFEINYSKKDGSTNDVEVFSSKTKINGKTFLYCIIQDVTEKKKLFNELIVAKNKAEENDRLKTAFLNNISHELRTPMNGILGFSELLKKPDIRNEKRDQFLRVIEKSGQRMLNTITEIVEISKIETKQIKLEISKTDINKIISDLHTMYKPESDSKNIELVFELGLPNEKSIIKTDSNKLNQILKHLLTNAIKFTEKGRISLGYKVVNSSIEFYVNDTGVGLTAEYKDHLFKSFTQGSTSYSRDYEGLGLGLSISLAYVELMGGQLNVESEFDKGSNFHFSIPYVADEAQLPEKKKGIRIQNNTTPHVLIVEDEPTSLHFLSIILQNENLKIYNATNGAEAIEIIKTNQDISVVLMDLKMPGIDGFKATQKIKELRPDLFVIAQTAYAFDSDKQKAFGAGCDDYITKPIKKNLLLEKINALLN